MEYLKERDINENCNNPESWRNPNIFERDLYTFNKDIKNEIEIYGYTVEFEEVDKMFDWSRRWYYMAFRHPESCINFGNIDYLNSCPNDEIEAETTKEYTFLVRSITQEIITSNTLEIYENNNHIIADTLAEPAGLVINPVDFSPMIMFYAKLKRINPIVD